MESKKTSPEQQVLTILKNSRRTVTFAESCTGGLAAARLVSLSSASSVFAESFVTYANEAKIRRLGVLADTIARFGVVSEEVAGQMASGAAKAARADVAVGISGIAGPDGGTEQKPVGTVCFGFWVNGEIKTFTKHFGNIGRNEVRNKSVDFVFETLCDLL